MLTESLLKEMQVKVESKQLQEQRSHFKLLADLFSRYSIASAKLDEGVEGGSHWGTFKQAK